MAYFVLLFGNTRMKLENKASAEHRESGFVSRMESRLAFREKKERPVTRSGN